MPEATFVGADSLVRDPATPGAGSRKGGAALTLGVHREVLPNGATLLLKRATASPVVAVIAYFKVGYFHEADHESGLAHLMEHMFFKGSRDLPGPEDVGRTVNALGGSLNAGTIYDRTFYYFVLPKESLEPAVRIMADAVIRPVLDEAEMKKEIEVIIEESNRKRDNPSAMATELMFELAFDTHRMRRWRIGSDAVLRAMTRELAVDFHDRLYRPEHLIISIVGDLELEPTRNLVAEAFADFATGSPLKEGSPAEPPQRGLKIGARRAAIRQGFLELGFKTGGVNHPDQDGLDLLAEILGGGSSSRLFRAVKAEAGLVRGIDASSYAFEDVGLFHISATFEPALLPAARQRLFTELERVRRWGIFADELAMAKNQLEAKRLFQLEEVRGQAVSLAYHEAYGDYQEADRALERIRALTARDVQRLAREYLDPERATLYSYLPQEAEDPQDSPEQVRRELEAAREAVRTRPGRPAPNVPATARRLPSPRAGISRKPCLTALPGGGHLLVQEDAQLPTLAVGVYFPGGKRLEAPQQSGLTRLAMRAARSGGTQTRHPDAMLAAIEAIGATLAPELDTEYVGYKVHLPASRSGAGLELLSDILVNPVFAPDRLDRERESIVADIRQGQDQPGRMAIDLMLQARFGTAHPLGSPSAGREEVVSSVGRDEVIAWRNAAVSRSQRLVVAVGSVQARALEAVLAERLAGLPEGRAVSPMAEAAPMKGISEQVGQLEKQQTALAFGFAAPPPSHPDHAAMLILLEVLSGFGGRLGAELRGRQSLAYTVSAYELGFSANNLMVCFIAGEATKEQACRQGMLNELAKLRETPISREELDRGRAALLGRRATGLQTLGSRVSRYAWVELKGIGLEGFAALPQMLLQVTEQDVRAVAERYLTLERFAIGVARGRGK